MLSTAEEMEISPSIINNPGIFEHDDKRRKALSKFKDIVKKSKFLDKEQKKNWSLLGYYLSTPDLNKAERSILQENLRRLKIQHKLERLKRKEK